MEVYKLENINLQVQIIDNNGIGMPILSIATIHATIKKNPSDEENVYADYPHIDGVGTITISNPTTGEFLVSFPPLDLDIGVYTLEIIYNDGSGYEVLTQERLDLLNVYTGRL